MKREKKSGLPREGRLYDVRLHNLQYICTFVYYVCVAYPALGISHLVFIQINENWVQACGPSSTKSPGLELSCLTLFHFIY